MRNSLMNADGTFAKGHEAEAFAAFDYQLASAMIVPGFAKAPGVAGSPPPANPHVVVAKASQFCPNLSTDDNGSCGCPGGGTMTWAAVGTGSNATQTAHVMMRIKLAACAVEGMTEDGTIFVQLDAEGSGIAESIDELVDYHTTITGGTGQPSKVDFDLDVQATEMRMSLQVADGRLVISKDYPYPGTGPAPGTSSGDTKYTVDTKDGSFRCTRYASGSGSCTGPSNDFRTF